MLLRFECSCSRESWSQKRKAVAEHTRMPLKAFISVEKKICVLCILNSMLETQRRISFPKSAMKASRHQKPSFSSTLVKQLLSTGLRWPSYNQTAVITEHNLTQLRSVPDLCPCTSNRFSKYNCPSPLATTLLHLEHLRSILPRLCTV